MRNRKSGKKPNTEGNFIGVMLVLTAVLALILNRYFTSAVVNTAVVSAGLALPQGTVQVIKNNFFEVTPSEKTTQNQNQDTDTVTINDNKVTESTASSVYSTPKDIIGMGEEYNAQYSGASHDGAIIERQYDASNATSVFQNITVRNTTPSHSINIEASLNEKANLSVTDKTQPTVLIFHTHTTESYELADNNWYTSSYATRSNDLARNMVRVGDAICEELEKGGVGYIHDREIHDAKYTGAYDRSRESILKIMQENPSIQIVLDVHRDAICQSDGTKVKPVVTINNKKAAQIMIIAGCEDGKVTSFPHWEQNLTFALQLHKTAEDLYPGLMRPILFSARKYNMDVVPCSALLEIGSDSNTLAEAEYSGHLIGRAITEFVNNNS